MKAFELRDLSETRAASSTSRHARRELFGLRFQHATGELDNTAGMRRAKKEIARALTIAQRAWD